MKIVVASHNKGKIREFKNKLEPLGYEVIPCSELGFNMDTVEETEDTFAGNARLKAKYVYDQCHITTVSDDSGLVIEALPDILGVKSARFMGEDTDYPTKMNEVLRLLSDKTNRNAYFHSSLALVGEGIDEDFTGQVHGVIAPEISGSEGFGYDPIFIPEGYAESFGSLSIDVKNELSHRAIALEAMVAWLQKR